MICNDLRRPDPIIYRNRWFEANNCSVRHCTANHFIFRNPNSSRTRSNCSLSIVLILVSSRGISHFSTKPNCNSYTIHYSLTELRSTIREDIFSVALVYDSRTSLRSIREGPRPATSQLSLLSML